MPPLFASFLIVGFVMWLLYRDVRSNPGVSKALWIPVAWAFIIASKPISCLLDPSRDLGSTEYLEDSLLDKGLFLFLIIAGVVVLVRRRLNWNQLFAWNRLLFLFFAYLALSIVWSEDPMVAAKRWVKDAGNLVMVMVILSDKDAYASFRSFLARCAYLLLPLSVLVVKYYPHISNQYSVWTGQSFCVAITTNKNTLGIDLFVCGLSLFWMLLKDSELPQRHGQKLKSALYVLLLLMTLWLLIKAKSSTAVTCGILGAGILFAARIESLRRHFKSLGAYACLAGVIVGLVYVSGLWDMVIQQFAASVGRDASFHGRTAIWQALLKQDVNPVIGVGYSSFWTPKRMQKISEGYHYLLNEAHNGFLETYLNSGVVGVVLLVGLLISAAGRIRNDVVRRGSYASLSLAFVLAALFYAISEAIFNRLSLMWFVLLLVIVQYPARQRKRVESRVSQGREDAASTASGQRNTPVQDVPLPAT